MRKGCLEMAVLASLWHGRLYGLEILRVLERDSHLVLAEGTIYPILNRLRAEGPGAIAMGGGRSGASPQVLRTHAERPRPRHPHGRDLDAVLCRTRLPD